MKVIAFTLLVPILLGGCASSGPHEADYQRVAEKLIAIEPCEPQYCSGEWYPLERVRTEADGVEAQRAVKACVAKLKEHIPAPPSHPTPPHESGLWAGRAPTEVIAAAQIVTCMREKGWQYSLEGMVVM